MHPGIVTGGVLFLIVFECLNRCFHGSPTSLPSGKPVSNQHRVPMHDLSNPTSQGTGLASCDSLSEN
ncbi:hypothetical protein PILCRDRAFT_824518 [Piloderma croceum F 1598]|uniref:Uncharacterized protein n=1 Tax=Piloderma croceum (strain F 1598) TaxID=765440 RepID=A0A0C3AWB6_PILCF|nr:hypothetical protein PILCRDRAFT_824518 [Piloderma croceum F 1598]